MTARIPEIKLDSYIIDVAVAVPGLAPAAPATDDNDDDGDDGGDREASPAVPPSLAESTAAAVNVAPCSRGADVAAAGDLAQTATYVIELNPFHPTTGACLFDWERDAALLREGPVDLRLVESPQPHIDAYLQPFHALLDDAVARPPGMDSTAWTQPASKKCQVQ